MTLIVSRQQVLPQKDPEVAAALEENFLRRGVQLLKGARATGIERPDDGVDGAVRRRPAGRRAPTCCWRIGSLPNSEGLGLDAAGVEVDEGGYVPVDQHLPSNVGHIYAAGDLSGKLPLSSVAAMQGRKIAEHVMGLHTREHRAPRLRQGGVGHLHRARDRRRRAGRGRRLRQGAQDPGHQGAVLGRRQGHDQRRHPRLREDRVATRPPARCSGGSIVGRHAAELIAVIALAVTAGLTVTDIVDSLFVHPTLSEALAEAAD